MIVVRNSMFDFLEGNYPSTFDKERNLQLFIFKRHTNGEVHYKLVVLAKNLEQAKQLVLKHPDTPPDLKKHELGWCFDEVEVSLEPGIVLKACAEENETL